MSQVEGSSPSPPPSTKDDLYYGAIVAGWLNTKLERDKSILTLSAGGIGLLATLMTTVGPQTRTVLVLYALASLAFAVALISILLILDRNADHLKHVQRGKVERDPRLALLDRISFWAFIVGALFLATLGVMAGIDKVATQAGAQMNKADNPTKVSTDAVVTDKRSYNGISDMRPPAAQQPAAEPPAVAPAAVPPAPAPAPAPAASQGDQGAGGGSK